MPVPVCVFPLCAQVCSHGYGGLARAGLPPPTSICTLPFPQCSRREARKGRWGNDEREVVFESYGGALHHVAPQVSQAWFVCALQGRGLFECMGVYSMCVCFLILVSMLLLRIDVGVAFGAVFVVLLRNDKKNIKCLCGLFPLFL